MKSVFVALLACAGTATAAALTAGTPALAATDAVAKSTPVNYACQGKADVFGAFAPPGNTSVKTTVTTRAPSTVKPGQMFRAAFDTTEIAIPRVAVPYPVSSVKDLALLIDLPTNATVKHLSLKGGKNLGKGKPSVGIADKHIVLRIPGPIAAGSKVKLPLIKAAVKAGQSGTIMTRLAGSSFADPGLTLRALGGFGPAGIWGANASCFPKPDPGPLTSIAISG